MLYQLSPDDDALRLNTYSTAAAAAAAAAIYNIYTALQYIISNTKKRVDFSDAREKRMTSRHILQNRLGITLGNP